MKKLLCASKLYAQLEQVCIMLSFRFLPVFGRIPESPEEIPVFLLPRQNQPGMIAQTPIPLHTARYDDPAVIPNPPFFWGEESTVPSHHVRFRLTRYSQNQLFFVLFLFLLSFLTTLSAQVSEGGTPYSFSTRLSEGAVPTITMPLLNNDSLLLAAMEEARQGLGPQRYGEPIAADIGLENAGRWEELAGGGRLWRVNIVSPGASSINLVYDRFYLPPGAQLFVYNKQKNRILGAFTSRNNKQHKKFATDLLRGDQVTLEYYEPPGVQETAKIHIGKVVHGFRWLDFGDSEACNNNVNCLEGAMWFEEINTTVLTLNADGYWCTGLLLNNVREDLTQYFLTANNCLDDQDPAEWVFRFNYQSPDCNNTNGPVDQTVAGASLVAEDEDSNYSLLEIEEAIPESYNVHYAGWESEDVAPLWSVAIHHPTGDIKKISFEDDQANSVQWPGSSPDSYWQVFFEDGTVEHGSSGSALFNEEHKVVGQLRGSPNYDPDDPYCDQPEGWYGKFSLSWDNGLSALLDPDATGQASLGQIAAYDVTIDQDFFFATTLPASNYVNTVGSIETDGDVTLVEDVDAVFRARENVILNPGFSAESGSGLRAYIAADGTENEATKEVSARRDDLSKTTAEETAAKLVEGDEQKAEVEIPVAYALSHAYPNPFNPETKIKYDLPAASQVRLIVYDILGRQVKQLIFDHVQAGYHHVHWDGTNDAGASVSSGTYIYRLIAEAKQPRGRSTFVQTKTMMLVR